MPTNRRIFSQDAAATGDASSAQGLVLHLDANDEDSIESGGANQGNGSGTWFDIANHDLNVPLVDKASNLQLHLNASDTTSFQSGDSTWTDISGNSRTVTANGGVENTYATDIRGSFDLVENTGDFFEVTHHDNISPSSSGITFEAWVTPDNTSNTNNIFFIGNDSGFGEFSAGTNSATAFITTTTSGAIVNNIATGNVITAGQLHHIVFTMSNVTNPVVNIYVDGTFQVTNTGSGTVIDTNANLKIGRYTTGNANDFDGKIHAVRVYNTVLTASEVAQNFRAGNFLSYSSIYSTNLQLHLDAGDVTTVSASTWSDKANSNNGTLTGFSSTLSDFYDKELGNWLEFDGTDDKVTNSDCNLDSANISITAWVFLDHYGTGDGTSIVHLGSGSTAGTSILFRERSNGKLSVYDFGAANLDTDNVELSLSTWHYVALTVSGTTYKLYVDGVEKKSGTETAYSGDDRLIIGNYNNVSSGASSQFWDGKMGVVKLYNVALTPAQVAQNYLATKNDYPNGFNFAISSGVEFLTNSSPSYNYFHSDAAAEKLTSGTINIDISMGMTVSIWLRRHTTTSTYQQQFRMTGDNHTSYLFAISGFQDIRYFNSDDTSGGNDFSTYGSSGSWTTDWINVIHVREANGSGTTNNRGEIYINGVSILEVSNLKAAPNITSIGFGDNVNASRVDNVDSGMLKIFQRPFSDAEALAEFNATKATFGIS